MKLSIIIPVYNEERTLERIINRVRKVNFGGIKTEILIVNDSSTDNSQRAINKLVKKHSDITALTHKNNMGKGAAIRTGLKNFSGDVVTIQDADLEYDPEDFKRLLRVIMKGESKVVYGSRFLNKGKKFTVFSHYFGNKFLTLITRVLFMQRITDMETCYKMMTRDVAKSLKLKANKFDIEPEITCKVTKKGHKIIEVPISYNPRNFDEGKKITWKDGFSALYTLLKYRFFD